MTHTNFWTMSPLWITECATLSSLGFTAHGIVSSKESEPFHSEVDGLPVFAIAPSEEAFISSSESLLPPKLDRTTRISCALARHFIDKDIDASSLGIFIGSSRGSTHSLEESIFSFSQGSPLRPTVSPLTTLGNIAGWTAQILQSSGWACSHSVTCSTSLHSIAQAVAWIQSGMIARSLCGGVEAPLTRFTLAQMHALGIYTPYSPPFPCRPLSLPPTTSESMPSTFTLGEGGALFLLEPPRHRGEPPLGIIRGIGCAKESIANLTGISEMGDGYVQAMTRALTSCRSSTSIDAVILHAPGTRRGDRAELCAIRQVFPDALPLLISTKHFTGHALGASGALSIAYALSLFKDLTAFRPPRFDTLMATSLSRPINNILVNASGFGGNTVSVLLSAS
jgi:3-oxoacyl-[acyl-carrier-protein] synthase II